MTSQEVGLKIALYFAECDRIKATPRMSEITRLIELYNNDDPVLDGTDFAHPAWWRGHEYTSKQFCQRATDILDGKDDGHGVSRDPWETLRRRLLKLVDPKK